MSQQNRINAKTEENKKSPKRQPASAPPDRLTAILHQAGNRAVQRALIQSEEEGMPYAERNDTGGMPLEEQLQARLRQRSHPAGAQNAGQSRDVQAGSVSNRVIQMAGDDYLLEDQDLSSYGGDTANYGIDTSESQSERGDENSAVIEDFANKGYEINDPSETQQGTAKQEGYGGSDVYAGGEQSGSDEQQGLPSADYFASEQAYETLKGFEEEGYEINYP